MRREQVDKLKRHLRAKGYHYGTHAGDATGAGIHSLASVDAEGSDEEGGHGEAGGGGKGRRGRAVTMKRGRRGMTPARRRMLRSVFGTVYRGVACVRWRRVTEAT